jgi:hypothetical protein
MVGAMSKAQNRKGDCRESGEGQIMSADKIQDGSEWRDLKVGDILTLEYGKALQNYRGNVGKYEVFGTNGKIV